MSGKRDDLHVADWWHTDDEDRAVCTLCPRFCKIHEGQAGFCYIRQNIGGTLYNLGYGRSTGFCADPIEKKPLNHFMPGTMALSFGTAGCNLGCRFCQNWDISKARLSDRKSLTKSPQEVVELALESGCSSIAYTYNDPTIWGEFVIDVSKAAHQQGIKNVMVSAGYITPEAREDVYRHVDAANIDLKGFTNQFYRKLTLTEIEPVLDTLKWLVNETEVWTEITTLLIPGHNDSTDELNAECEWIIQNLNPDVPVHFTAFHPDFKMLDVPRTPPETLIRAREIALEQGLRHVYVGNIRDEEGQTTWCPNCQSALVVRDWHAVRLNRLQDSGKCPDCATSIPGRWEGANGTSPGQRWTAALP